MIDPAFRAFIGPAAERFGYLHPEFTVNDHGEFVELTGVGDPVAAIRDFRYTLYREKIHTEGQPLRDAMLRGLVG